MASSRIFDASPAASSDTAASCTVIRGSGTSPDSAFRSDKEADIIGIDPAMPGLKSHEPLIATSSVFTGSRPALARALFALFAIWLALSLTFMNSRTMALYPPRPGLEVHHTTNSSKSHFQLPALSSCCMASVASSSEISAPRSPAMWRSSTRSMNPLPSLSYFLKTSSMRSFSSGLIFLQSDGSICLGGGPFLPWLTASPRDMANFAISSSDSADPGTEAAAFPGVSDVAAT
mmetsp:Transcript_30228/g.66090  ORF Transcript_30228/g.66090 Transcript_30228/m.66090 type:complete len:233 (+) Transcript_30228:2202-2900(+)